MPRAAHSSMAHVALPPRAARSAQAAARGAEHRWDLLQLAIGATILTYVWRLQDLYSVFAAIKLPILAAAAALGLFLIDRQTSRSLRAIAHPVTTALCVIMALAVLSVPTSVYRGMSFRFIIDDMGKNFLLFVVVAASIRSTEDLRRALGVVVMGGAIYALYVYLFVPIGESGRLGGIVYYDANDLGMLLVSTIPLALFFVLRAKAAFLKVGVGLAIVLFLLVIIKTGSRGAFVGLVAVTLYALFKFRTITPRMRLVALAVGAAIMLLRGGDTYWTMMGTMLDPKADYNWSGNAESGRMDIWKRGVGYMVANPVTGVGVSAFPVAEGKISPLAARQQYGFGLKWSAAHNSFVQIGAELGVIGLAAFMFLIFRAFRTPLRFSGRVPDQDRQVLGVALAGAVLGYAVAGFWLSQAYAAFSFTLFGLVVGFAKICRSGDSSAVPVTKRVGRGRALRQRGRGRWARGS